MVSGVTNKDEAGAVLKAVMKRRQIVGACFGPTLLDTLDFRGHSFPVSPGNTVRFFHNTVPANLKLAAGKIMPPTKFRKTVASEDLSLRLPSLFTDNMVLQRDAPVSIWGEGRPRETILALINRNGATARVDAKGRWKMKLPAMPAGGPYDMTISDSKQEIKIRNVCVGEVWVASGQSNMEWVVGRSIFFPASPILSRKSPRRITP